VDAHRQLAAAVIGQAVEDMRDVRLDPAKRAAAAEFIESADGAWWLSLAGLDAGAVRRALRRR
jgi:hypothetical protein